MAKLSDVMQGTRAIKRVPLPLVNVPSEFSEDQPELIAQREKDRAEAGNMPPGSDPAGAFSVPEVGIRVMTGLEQAEVFRRARAFCVEGKGNPDNPTDALYNFAVGAYTVAIACVDPDSNPKDPEPFFGRKGDVESGFRALIESPLIGRDGIVFLHEQQEMWQDVCSPQALKVGAERLWEIAREVATSSDARPFLLLRHGMRWKLTQFLADQWLNSQISSSPSSFDSETLTSS